MLFFSNVMGFHVPKLFWDNKVQIIKLYKEGQNRIDKMLDLSKIIKNNRTTKILIKNTLMSEDVQYRLKHSSKNIIDLEEKQFDDLSFEKVLKKKGTRQSVYVNEL